MSVYGDVWKSRSFLRDGGHRILRSCSVLLATVDQGHGFRNMSPYYAGLSSCPRQSTEPSEEVHTVSS